MTTETETALYTALSDIIAAIEADAANSAFEEAFGHREVDVATLASGVRIDLRAARTALRDAQGAA